MSMATPTIEKEYFFEYNRVQKSNISCKLISEYEFLYFSKAGRRLVVSWYLRHNYKSRSFAQSNALLLYYWDLQNFIFLIED